MPPLVFGQSSYFVRYKLQVILGLRLGLREVKKAMIRTINREWTITPAHWSNKWTPILPQGVAAPPAGFLKRKEPGWLKERQKRCTFDGMAKWLRQTYPHTLCQCRPAYLWWVIGMCARQHKWGSLPTEPRGHWRGAPTSLLRGSVHPISFLELTKNEAGYSRPATWSTTRSGGSNSKRCKGAFCPAHPFTTPDVLAAATMLYVCVRVCVCVCRDKDVSTHVMLTI